MMAADAGCPLLWLFLERLFFLAAARNAKCWASSSSMAEVDLNIVVVVAVAPRRSSSPSSREISKSLVAL